MEPLEVVLFGGFQLRRGGEDVPPLPSRAARTLLAYLAIHRGIRHPRDHLAERFWPDLPANRGRRRLSHTLWQVQDALGELSGEVDHLDVAGDTIGLTPSIPCWVDVEEFVRGLDRARERRGASQARVRDLTELEAVVGLYRGEFMAGHEDEWVLAERQQLHVRYLEALGWLVGLAKAHAAYDDALIYARRLTNEDPLREDGHREVMRLSMLLGRASEAIRQYERVRDVLAEELGTVPSAETEALHARIVRQRRLSTPAAEPALLPDHIPLIGRDREQDRALTVLERALVGRGGALLVEGEPGVGTSRLLAEVVDDAGWRGFACASVGCSSPDAVVAYGVIQDVLDEVLTPLRVEQLRPRVGPVWLAEAATLAPALAAGTSAPGADRPPELASTDGARRMRDALIRILAALAEIDPLLLVIDDAQWADLESLDVLAGLSEVVDDHRLVAIVGYRGDEAREQPATWAALREVDRVLRPERVVLGPLDAFSTGELIRVLGRGHSVSGAAVSRLHRETGGNPRFVVETLRMLSDEQRLEALGVDDPEVPLPVPGSIRELLTERLERLTPEPRTVLELAALEGGSIELELLADAAELPRTAVVTAVDALVRGSELVPQGEAFAVHHEQLRRVVVESLDEGARRAAHQRLG
ncbi:MAG: BTAD domain-containing putative transcriptional regulator, partial [Nitriliruptoraceae bacterium]